jgi:penicillin amidase
VLGILLLLLVVAAGIGLLWVRSQVKASLPLLEGERAVAGLAAPVTVEKDDLGVPTIRGGSRADVAQALGFLHAQDRFFQMDAMRRQAAGELSEILGPGTVGMDRAFRIHRFLHVAQQVVARATPAEKQLLESYAAGVNAGLAALKGKPFEYLALRSDPAPWLPEDTVLVVLAMYTVLQDMEGSRERSLSLMHDTLPAPVVDFLEPRGTEWDAPIAGEPFVSPPVPGPEVLDLRAVPAPAAKAAGLRPSRPASPSFLAPRDREEAVAVGSNNWAVAGTHTADGKALFANDMHLPIGVPNTWYRASLILPDAQGGSRRITGVTLPGTPIVAAGSNGYVAWGFTNSYADFSDVILLETVANDPETYLSPQGPKKIERVAERIRVKGGEDIVYEVPWTMWGPVIGKDHKGRSLAYAWTAHRPDAVNLRFVAVEESRTLEEAQAAANRAGIPGQNFVAADRTGRIGWTIAGQLPRRVGFEGRVPTTWSDGSRGWNGFLTPEEIPRVVDPPLGRIWTANARVVNGPMLATLGDGGYAFGARNQQIRDHLMTIEKATPADLLKVQLDDRAVYLTPWRDLLLKTLTPAAVQGNPRRAEMRRVAEQGWTGRAGIDSAGYRMVRGFKESVVEQVFQALTVRCREVNPEFYFQTWQFQGSVWKLLNERPQHLLDPRFKTWDEQLLAAADALLAVYERQGTPLDEAWGQRNAPLFQHPLSQAVPFLSRYLDVPRQPLPGDENMPRVQVGSAGASERLVVSPGQEDKGYFHMPIGQSGHPLSPYYQKGHDAWVKGDPTPFLPGPAVHTLRLVPAG